MQLLTATLILFIFSTLGQGQWLTNDRVEIWALKLSTELYTLSESLTTVENIVQAYEARNVSAVSLNASDIASQFRQRLGGLLSNKVDALDELINVAEKAYSDYKYNDSLKPGDVQWYNAKKIQLNSTDPVFICNDRFQRSVNANISAIQVPTNVYDGGVNVLNAIEWSNAVDAQFNKNYYSDKTIKWQYFGSATGFFRLHPGAIWRDYNSNGQDLYDCRKRPWYISSSSTAKDVVILLDVSGSMHGMPLDIAKISIQSLIRTFGENDFLNIVFFNKDINLSIPCFKDVVQTSESHKYVFGRALAANILDGGIADFSKAYDYAFQMLQRSRSKQEQKRCHQLIMVFSDGTEERPKAVFDKYNADKQISVITYGIGTVTSRFEALRWMACYNKGKFIRISNVGAIPDNIQKYLTILSNPTALTKENYFTWSPVYTDVSGLGLLTTVAAPVFFRPNVSTYNQSENYLLGVMGSDVPLRDVNATIPYNLLGSNSYCFGVDNNGRIFFHPIIGEQRGYLSDPPDLQMHDLEIVHGNILVQNVTAGGKVVEFKIRYNEQLRKNMLSRLTGMMYVTTTVHLSNSKRVMYMERQYHYGPVLNDSFSFGTVLPKEGCFNFETALTNQEKTEGLALLNSRTRSPLFLQIWRYCSLYSQDESDILFVQRPTLEISNISGIINRISELVFSPNNAGFDECSKDLANRLVLDAIILQQLEDYWTKIAREHAKRNYIFRTFYGSSSGLTKLYQGGSFQCKESLSGDCAISEVPSIPKNTIMADYYRLAVAQINANSFVYLANLDRSSLSVASIEVVKAISLEEDANVGVVGFQMNSVLLFQILIEVIPECITNNSLRCYILDRNGYVVMFARKRMAFHSHKVQIPVREGKFVGVYEPAVVTSLIDKKIMTREEFVTYNQLCNGQKPVNTYTIASSASQILTPFRLSFKILMGWLAQLSTTIIHLAGVFQYWISSTSGVCDAPQSKNTSIYTCALLNNLYIINQNTTTHNGTGICSSCSRNR
ncbi:uncharacterized protein TRIADDRAFT_56917 [Trichoplax adhaerens]|uniref:VWFA domain-containing protein n=1 Tax=Trichoplax adhaerens TaxID=10228 RepID=B3RWX4_TRIAD|nr:hypothetical protein TRIADDRAFT_56917 [Trichoplax adhaerens]EDV24771.1 hypothetical protein TRIADDRAFT_56917 [Trichoplax adhaerens]|eukprot:XP_002112661.1 hypothetical protein TRIADDRAFT_56917 [Trichoplax adhaerens]